MVGRPRLRRRWRAVHRATRTGCTEAGALAEDVARLDSWTGIGLLAEHDLPRALSLRQAPLVPSGYDVSIHDIAGGREHLLEVVDHAFGHDCRVVVWELDGEDAV